jgi:hypothetical protein
VNAPAAPKTPTIATATAAARWAPVAVGNSSGESEIVVVLAGVVETDAEGEVKNDVGRAMRITPKREIREAY